MIAGIKVEKIVLNLLNI